MREHERRMHHPPMIDIFPGVNPEQVVRNVVAMSETVPGLLDVVYGPPKIDPVTGKPLEFIDGRVIREEEKGLRMMLGNGGLRTTLRLTKPQWTAVATIVAALIAAIWGG